MVANILPRMFEMTWEEVLEKIEEIAHIHDTEIEFYDNASIYNLINKNFYSLFKYFEDFDDIIFKLMGNTGIYKIEKIDPNKIIHIQHSIDTENIRQLYEIVCNGLWDENYGEYPDTIYIPSIDKYLVYNGNHRTTLFYGLQKKINCVVWDNAFLSDLLDIAVKDYHY